MRAQLAAAEEAEDNAAIIELSRRIVTLAPADAETWETLARTEIATEDYDRCAQTLESWQKAVKQPPAAIEDFRGDLALKRKDYATAERHWLAFLARKPSATDAASEYDNLAELCVTQSRWIDTEKYRAKAVATEDSAARRVAHATALLRLRRWDAAVAEMAVARKMDAADNEVKEWLPQFERLQKFLPRIKALEARIAKSPNDAALLLERARLLTLAERPLLALDDCQRVMKQHPESMRARIQTGEALLDTEDAEGAAKLQVNAQLTRGEDRHVPEKALHDLAQEDAAITQNPDSAELVAARSKTLRGLRQFTLALADAQAALALDEDSAAANFEAAHNLDELGHGRDALECAVRATELNPKDPVAWYYRGMLEAQRADFTAALESQTHSLDIRESAVALREREKCARRIGRIKEADVDLTRLQQLEPAKE